MTEVEEAPILIAHGDSAVRRRCRRMFARDAQHIVEARNGRDALVEALVRPPALLLTELRLPLVDGYTLCEVLRCDAATADLPILAIDAIVAGDEPERAIRAGANGFVEFTARSTRIRAEANRVIAACGPLRAKAEAVRARAGAQMERSASLFARSEKPAERHLHLHAARSGTVAVLAPPALTCPACGAPLAYERSHVAGANARCAEQWDDFSCESCGRFEYRHRTQNLRQVR